MKVRFLQTVTVKAQDGETFEEGKVYDLVETSGARWIKRGVAVRFVKGDAGGKAETATIKPAEKAVTPNTKPNKKNA